MGKRNIKEKQVKVPGPDHPISILAHPARIVVSVASCVIGETRKALTLHEAPYPPGKPEDVADVIVFPASDKSRWITGGEYSGGWGIETLAVLRYRS